MRKQWFGDSRDYVKWSCIRQEATDGFVVLYGAMLRPDTPLDDPLLDDNVIQFFNRQRNFAALSELFPRGLTVEDSLYSVRGADAYFSHLVERMCLLQAMGKILVFLDPDTGIEPKGKLRDEHLRVSDVRKICQALNPLDKLVIYQHALREAHWMVGFKVRLEAVCVETDCVVGEAFQAPNVAKDVCFFVITKLESARGK